jgi:hypothetical protein
VGVLDDGKAGVTGGPGRVLGGARGRTGGPSPSPSQQLTLRIFFSLQSSSYCFKPLPPSSTASGLG